MNVYLREVYELCASVNPPSDPIKNRAYFLKLIEEIKEISVEGLNERSKEEL